MSELLTNQQVVDLHFGKYGERLDVFESVSEEGKPYTVFVNQGKGIVKTVVIKASKIIATREEVDIEGDIVLALTETGEVLNEHIYLLIFEEDKIAGKIPSCVLPKLTTPQLVTYS